MELRSCVPCDEPLRIWGCLVSWGTGRNAPNKFERPRWSCGYRQALNKTIFNQVALGYLCRHRLSPNVSSSLGAHRGVSPQFSEVANAIYPDTYERFLSIVSVSNLDMAGLLSAGCLISTDFYDRLLVSTLGPIAVLAVLGCTYKVATWRNRGAGGATRTAIVNKHVSIMLLVAFLVYGSVSATVFGMFACEDLDDGGSYLRGDYSVRCDTDRHRLFQGYAGFMIFIYPIGIPLLFAVLLFSHREALVDGSGAREDNPTIKPFADLWQPYRPSRYMFELLEYLRRILLTGIVVFIFPNTAAQIAVTFMMELFFFVVSVFLLPYRKR